MSAIFFPGFEPSDPNWLKFALLYLDEIRPIIPYSARHLVSDRFQRVIDWTDLVDPCRPSHPEGELASADAILIAKRTLSDPDYARSVWGTHDMAAHWRAPRPDAGIHLWQEKYEHTWHEFCHDNGLATPSERGLLMSRSLGAMYTCVLANCIADSRGVSSLSDESQIRNVSFALRTHSTRSLQDEIRLLETHFPLVLPRNLSYVSLEQVIRLRNKTDSSKKRKAFRNALSDIASAIERGEDPYHLTDRLADTSRAMSDLVTSLGTGALSLGFGMWLVASGAEFDDLEAICQVLGGTAFSVDKIISIRNTWQNTKPQRLARQYAADLAQLHE